MGGKTQEHTKLVSAIRLEGAIRGYALFHNQRYKGPIVTKGKITKAWADCGLCTGALDLIGWSPDGRFVAIDAKIGDDKPRKEQQDFADAVIRNGGIAGFAWSVKDFVDIITE